LILKNGVDILIATGRLLDLHKQGFIELDICMLWYLMKQIKCLIWVCKRCKKKSKLTKKQTTLFSLQQCQLSANWLKCFNKPETVTVSPVSSTAENVEQHVYFVEKQKKKLLYHLIKKTYLMC
jgi:ATP-dependent RNA helicase RhlE